MSKLPYICASTLSFYDGSRINIVSKKYKVIKIKKLEGKMGGWKLSKEEFERCKREAVAKTVDKFFPDITNGEKKALCEFFEELFNEFMVSERIFI